MEFQDTKVRKRNPKKIITDSLSELYPNDVQLYTVPPGNEISLSEFEDLALERLQLLRILEQATQKGHSLYSDAWFECIKSDMKKQKLIKFYLLCIDVADNLQHSISEKLQARRADLISHFILRLAYCRSEELRRWFLARELEWFKVRFIKAQAQSPDTIRAFLELNKLTYKAISMDEKDSIRSELFDSTAAVDEVDSTDFYKVPFTEVSTLVSNRRVYIHEGFAYIPNAELITCIMSIFRTQLSEALAFASRKIPALDDVRVNNLLSNLHMTYTGRDYATPESKAAINIEHLDQYARKDFPLCMRHIHETFRATHHMKHNSRMQYGLFIKGIGVTFEDCMRLWRDEFTKLIDQNDFEKRYSYLVKHNYGKVGSMVNYTPYSCMKIIMSSVGSGEHHGCPFRHFDTNNLQQKMTEYGINNNGVEEIMSLIKNKHYQIACTKYFEYTHGQASQNAINHPNQYFDESRAVAGASAESGPSSKKAKVLPNPEKLDETWNQEMEM